jgi:hypothetical protein
MEHSAYRLGGLVGPRASDRQGEVRGAQEEELESGAGKGESEGRIVRGRDGRTGEGQIREAKKGAAEVATKLRLPQVGAVPLLFLAPAISIKFSLFCHAL